MSIIVLYQHLILSFVQQETGYKEKGSLHMNNILKVDFIEGSVLNTPINLNNLQKSNRKIAIGLIAPAVEDTTYAI